MGFLPLLVFSAIIFIPLLIIYLIKLLSLKGRNIKEQVPFLKSEANTLENLNLLKYGIIFLIFYLPIIYLFIWGYFIRGAQHKIILIEELFLFIVIAIFGFLLFLFTQRAKNV